MTKVSNKFNTANVTPVTTAKLPALPPLPTFDHLPPLIKADVPDTVLMQTLWRCLSVKRPHGGVGESQLAAWVASQVTVTMIDAAGNIHIDTRANDTHRTLLTAHLDTVHHDDGPNDITLDGKYWRGRKAALGADDGSGVALIMHLLSTGFKGYAVLFRGEECGGVGSKWLADNMVDLLGQFDRAVAFDRAGYSDVITHQSGGRCCSDTFAEALGAALTPDDFSMAFMPCDGGVYTDTAEFISIIPECTNLSVAYKNQHGSHEEQDVQFLQKLAKQLESVQWDSLPTERDPKVREPRYMGLSKYAPYMLDKDGTLPSLSTKSATSAKASTPAWYDNDAWCEDIDIENLLDALEVATATGVHSELREIVAELTWPEDPDMAKRLMGRIRQATIDTAVDMLVQQGMGASDVADYIFNKVTA